MAHIARWPMIVMFVVMSVVARPYQTVVSYLNDDGNHCNNCSERQHLQGRSNNCVPASIDSFPSDIMTQNQRVHGGIIFHIFITLYACYAIAIACDEYFIPSLDIISANLKISPNVAGATLMAAGTSAPEFFESIVGTFVTEGDIGVGTILGSAYFNILGIISICGFATGKVVPLEWWPLTRDCIIYCCAVCALLGIVYDEKIFWYEALVFIILYIIYVIIMRFNSNLEEFATNLLHRCRSNNTSHNNEIENTNVNDESTDKTVQSRLSAVFSAPPQADKENSSTSSEELHEFSPCTPAKGQGLIIWLTAWPIKTMFFCTLFDPKMSRWSKMPFVIFTFVMSISYIGALCWLIGWMVTVIGYTLGIPDNVVGLTILAAGTSVPEAFSSVSICKRGDGSMALSNCVGSNIFDIVMGLGLPWLIKACIPSETQYVKIISGGILYSTILLVTAVLVMYATLACFKFQLNKWAGAICIVAYALILAIEMCTELNIFGPINPTTCPASD